MDYRYARLKGSMEVYELVPLENGKVLLKKGNISINTTEDKIQILNDFVKKVKVYDTKIKLNKFDYKNEIMLRHMTKLEALDALDKFMDRMIANKVPMVKIIHGKNNGILRHTLHEYLKDNSNIQSYRIGNYYEGGIGVTIAFIK